MKFIQTIIMTYEWLNAINQCVYFYFQQKKKGNGMKKIQIIKMHTNNKWMYFIRLPFVALAIIIDYCELKILLRVKVTVLWGMVTKINIKSILNPNEPYFWNSVVVVDYWPLALLFFDIIHRRRWYFLQLHARKNLFQKTAVLADSFKEKKSTEFWPHKFRIAQNRSQHKKKIGVYQTRSYNVDVASAKIKKRL